MYILAYTKIYVSKLYIPILLHVLVFVFSLRNNYYTSECPAGQYRSADDTTCQPCPADTVMDLDGVAECKCLDGYFRNNENRFSDSDAERLSDPPNESPSDSCTRESFGL